MTAVATDAAGNSASTSTTLTVDTIAPAVAITTIEGGDTLINAAEAAGGIQISGTAEIGSSLTVNGSAVTVDGTGHWTTSVTPAGQGALTVTAVATDAAGNSASTSTTLTVDTIAPAVAITTIEGGDTLINAAEAAGGIQISGTAEIGSSLTVNGSAVTVDGTGHWTTSVTPAGQGALTVTAVATDAAGNSASTSTTLTVDTIAPAVAITTIEGGDTLINAAEAAGGIQISGTAEIGSSLTVNGSAVTVDGTGHWTTSVTPAGQGALTVTAVATDAAGNSASTTTNLTVDTIAPAVAITSTGGPVNQAAQTISGTGEAGTTITLFDNGAQLQLPTVTVGQNGLWSASVTLANGSNSLTAGDTDAAGNAGSSSAVIYTLSSVGPTVTESLTIDSGTSSSDRITSSDALSGTGLANTVVQFTIDGSPIATTVTADAQGIWSFTPTGLADGAHTIVASQTDGFGNTGTASLSFTLDTTAPAVAITTIEGGDTLINAAEAAGGIQISGTAEIGSSLTVNGAAVTVDGTGHWTTSVTPAGQGALTVTAVATDAAGNSASTSTTLTVDTIAPAVAITTIEGGDTLINAAEAAGGIQISGTAEIGSSLTVNGSAVTVDGTGHWTTSVTPAGQGALTVTAVATDAAGNSASTSTTLTVDTIAPAVAITTIEGGDTLINAAEAAGGIQISGTAEIGSSLTVNGSAVTVDGTGHWTTSVTPAGQGALTVTAVATDAAGNSASTTTNLTVDTIAPAVAITSTGGPVNQAAQTISGTGEAGTTITLFDNGAQLQLPTVTVGQNGLWSASVTLANGSNSLTAGDTDAAGNAGSSSAVIYTLSSVGPTVTESLTIDSGTSSSDRITSSDALSGTGLANTVVQFTIDGSPIATTVTADAQGIWSFTPTGLADGAHTIVASQTDGFGNTGTASLSFTLDTTAPAVAITTIEGGDTLINAAEAAGGIQISGTAEIGSSLTVNGSAVTVDGTGHWTTSVTPAGQGALTVTAVATDAAGNSASTSTTLTVDTIAPAVAITTIEGGDTLINAAEAAGGIQISGTAEIGSSLTVNGSAVTVDGTGHWTTSVTPAGQGALTVTAVATDAAGNSASTSTTLTVDTIAPAVAITTIEGGDTLINAAEAAGGIQISGTAEIGSSLTVNGAAVTVDGTGHWTTSVTPAGQGALTVTAVATDAAGNSASTTTTLTVDTIAPAVAITTIEGGDTLINAAEAAGGIQISGTAEIGSSLTVNGAAVTVDGTGHWTTSVTPAGQGALTVTAVATDAAGNSASTSTTLTVDTIAPAVAITTIEGGDTLINAAEAAGGIQISGTAEIGSSLTVNGAAVTVDGTGHWTTSVTPAGQGALTVTAVATDAAGNSATTSTTLTVDTIAPAVAITTIEGGDTLINAAEAAGGIQISGTAEIGSSLTVNGSAVTVDGTGHWTTSVTPAGQGALTVTAVATDAAGNSASTTTNLTVDTIAPAVAITSTGGPVNQAAQTISGTGEAGTTITLFDNGAQLQLPTVTVGQNGLWSATVTLANGSNSLTAQVTDAAGNISTSSAVIYTLNTTAPTGGTPVLTAASNSGTSHTDGITDVTAPTFTVALGSTVVAGDTVQLLLGGAALAHPVTHTVTAADISAGSVSLTVTAGDLGADGSKSITAQLSDSFGNSSTTAALTMTLDTTAPSGGTPALTAASDSGTSHTDGLTDVTAPTFTVALNPTVAAGDTVQLLLGGAALAHAVTHTVTAADISAGSISLAVTAGDLGADGSKSITAQFTDAAGNSSTTSADVITLDTTAPAKPPAAADAAVINGVVNAANDTASQALTGTAEGGSKVTIFDNGVQVGTTPAAANGSWTYVIGVLANGSSHSYTVMATDPAGNTSAPSNPLAFTVNTTAPAEPLAITAVAGSSLDNNTTITVSGTNGTLSSGEKIQVSSDGGSTWIDAVRTTGGSWSLIDPASHSTSFTYRARIIDAIGNSSVVATQAVIFASAGATVSLAGSPPFVVEFAGIGGNLALGSSAITSTVSVISIANGQVGIVGSASVTTSTGDGIDLAANGGTQANPSNIAIVPTGAIAGAATGISVIQNGTGSIGIVTSSTVIGLAGRGIFAEESATGIGTILISGSGDVTGIGDAFSGIVAENLDTADSSSVTVGQTGNVTGGYDGIRAVTNGSGNVIVTTGANATITGRLHYGIEATSNGTGSINVTMAAAAGDVVTSGSVGINAYNQATAIPQILGLTSSTISVTAYGTINSGVLLTGSGGRPAGILAGYRGGTTNTVNPAVYGDVTVDNFANINAAGGDGIRAYNYGNGNVTVNDHAGTITTKDQFGINAAAYGTGQVTVMMAAGDIINSGSYGVQAINLATVVPIPAASSVSVTSYGTIHAGFHLSPGAGPNQGVSAGYYPNNGTSDTAVNGTVSIDNFANVTSDNGRGVSAYNYGNGSVSITDEAGTFVSGIQYGLIGSSISSGAGSSGSVTINVLANATITAGAAISAAGINANENNAGNITINMAVGDTINSGGFGINAGNQATSASSSSQISITLQSSIASPSVINSGFSAFSAAGINAGYNGGSGTVNTSVAGNVFVDDYAAINAASGPGINLYNFGTGNLSATVEAGAAVAGATAGLNAYAQGGGNVTIANSGTLVAATGNGINVGTGTGSTGSGLPGNATGHGTISITNTGAVTGLGATNGGAVVQVDNFSANAATFNNSGTVTASMLSSGLSMAISVYSGTITSNTGGSTVNNNSGGTISGNVALSPTILVSTSTFNNAAGAIWNVNGNNWFGSATSAINNSGTINIAGNSGFYAGLAGAALTFNNSGTVEILPGGYGHIGGAVTGGTALTHGSFLIDDHAALEFAGSVVSTQTVSFADGMGVLRLDNPATFAGTISGLAVGDIIDFAGSIIASGASISGSTLTVTESNAATIAYTVANIAANASANLDVLATDKLVVVPTLSASMDVVPVSGLLNTTYTPVTAPTKSTTYIFSNDTISGATIGINISAPLETTATDIIAALINQSSSVSVTGASVGGIVAATGGASINVVNAANVTSASGIGISANTGAGNGSIDVVDYGNVSGGTAGIQAQAAGTGPINILVRAGATVTGATTSNASTGILVLSKLGSVSVTTLGSTINSGRSGIFVENQSTSVPLQNGVPTSIVVTTLGAINSGQGGTPASTGVPAGIVAGYLGNTSGQPGIPNPAIFGNVVVDNNATITAATAMGINAFNYGTGDVSVSNSATITATAAGTAAGSTAAGFTQYGISAYNYGTGNVTVATAGGTSIAAGGSGISAGNQATVIAADINGHALSTVTIDALGSVSSGAKSQQQRQRASGHPGRLQSRRHWRPGQCSRHGHGQCCGHCWRQYHRRGRRRHQCLQLRERQHHGQCRLQCRDYRGVFGSLDPRRQFPLWHRCL